MFNESLPGLGSGICTFIYIYLNKDTVQYLIYVHYTINKNKIYIKVMTRTDLNLLNKTDVQ